MHAHGMLPTNIYTLFGRKRIETTVILLYVPFVLHRAQCAQCTNHRLLIIAYSFDHFTFSY